jgi:hypothetical protein
MRITIVVAAVLACLWGCKEEAVSPRDVCVTVSCSDTEGDTSKARLVTYTEEREACSHYTPTRLALFGEFHSHTGFSFDARSYDNVLTPADALNFARGGEVLLAPLDDQGKGTRKVSLERPLDFAAITDHGEFLGEIYHCSTPGSAGYDSKKCQKYRQPESEGAFDFGVMLALDEPERDDDYCGGDVAKCAEAAKIRWQAMQDAAESAYDRTAECAFTSFVAYEYTNTIAVSNLHRNVIFRNANVPPLPVTHFEAPSPWLLWQGLDEQCNNADTGCDVIVLPHNSNLSNGNLFYPDYPGAKNKAEEREMAELRARMEPVVEMFQHKGDMECRNDMAFVNGDPDPFCGFEKIRETLDDCGEELGTGGMRLWGCVHRLDYVRNVLKVGLKEGERLGINPYELGFIGSTDTHNGTPGYVDDHDFQGHVGVVDDTPEKRLGDGNVTHDGIINNPGGLAAVWAVENSRDAIFEALRRKETFATSGPRIKIRLFGGWDYDSAICESDDVAATGYERGVPMGGKLSLPKEGATAPILVAQATWDAGTPGKPGTLLERLQIVKGWLNPEGELWEKVYHVAGNEESISSVDISTCATSGDGHESLCARWQDPEFNPDERAFYYARVIENPTCRWSTRKCNSLPAEARPESCSKDFPAKTVQERAWSSAIWYTP